MEDRETFRRNLIALMEARGCSQVELSQGLGLPLSTVSDWVHGRKFPRVDNMQRLAAFLSVRSSELMEPEGPDEGLHLVLPRWMLDALEEYRRRNCLPSAACAAKEMLEQYLLQTGIAPQADLPGRVEADLPGGAGETDVV